MPSIGGLSIHLCDDGEGNLGAHLIQILIPNLHYSGTMTMQALDI
jgi:hypothetical protein